MRQPCPGSIYNVVDDDPASRTEVMAYARSLLQSTAVSAASSSHTPVPAAADTDKTGSSPAVDSLSSQDGMVKHADSLKSGSDSCQAVKSSSIDSKGEKRVLNGKIKTELSLTWEFPTYREGLFAIHNGDRRPFD